MDVTRGTSSGNRDFAGSVRTVPMEDLLERLDEIEGELQRRAFLYDDPSVYRDALDETIARVRGVILRSAERRVSLD